MGVWQKAITGQTQQISSKSFGAMANFNAGLSQEDLFSEHFKVILGTIYPYKSIDEEGKNLVKTVMTSTVGDFLAGESFLSCL